MYLIRGMILHRYSGKELELAILLLYAFISLSMKKDFNIDHIDL